MGTDIHMLVEISFDGSLWRPVKNWGARKGPRDYELMSLLADVRNRSGRGTRTWQEPTTIPNPDTNEPMEVPGFWYDTDDGGHQPIKPIDGPRGVPADASLSWRGFVASWQARGGEVITSWLSLEDILGADWDQVVVREGYLIEEDYLKFRDEAVTPERWAHSTDDAVTAEEYEAGKRGEKGTSVFASWVVGPLRDLSNFHEMVKDLADEGFGTSTRLRFMLLFES